jgi:hypothetical protein
MANAAMISIAKDFSPFPAGRKRGDGPFTGETFREDFLLPKLKSGSHVILDIDGVEGLPSSFLEEVFGGLVRLGWSPADLRHSVEFKLTDPELEIYPPLAWRFADAASSVH